MGKVTCLSRNISYLVCHWIIAKAEHLISCCVKGLNIGVNLVAQTGKRVMFMLGSSLFSQTSVVDGKHRAGRRGGEGLSMKWPFVKLCPAVTPGRLVIYRAGPALSPPVSAPCTLHRDSAPSESFPELLMRCFK